MSSFLEKARLEATDDKSDILEQARLEAGKTDSKIPTSEELKEQGLRRLQELESGEISPETIEQEESDVELQKIAQAKREAEQAGPIRPEAPKLKYQLDTKSKKLVEEALKSKPKYDIVEQIKEREGWHEWPTSKESAKKLIEDSADKRLTVGYGKLVSDRKTKKDTNATEFDETVDEYVDRVWPLIEDGSFDSYKEKDTAEDKLKERIESDEDWVRERLDSRLAKNSKLLTGLTSYRYNYPDIEDTISRLNSGNLSKVISNMRQTASVDGVPNQGVWNRRKTEIKLVIEGLRELGFTEEKKTEEDEKHVAEKPTDVRQQSMSYYGVGSIPERDPELSVSPIQAGAKPVSDLKPIRDDEGKPAEMNVITVGELQRLMKRHGIPASRLDEVKALSSFFNAEVPSYFNRMERSKGRWSDIVAFGLPQKFSILTEDDDNFAEMADELRQMAILRKATEEQVMEMGLSFLMPQMAAAKGLKSLLAIGATTGVTAGFGQSATGEELQGMLIGGAFGTVLTGALAGAGIAAVRSGRLAQKMVDKVRDGHAKFRKLPKEKQIEMARVMDETWNSESNLGKSDRMDEFLTRQFTREDLSSKNLVPTLDEWQSQIGLRKPPRLKVRKQDPDDILAAEADYVIKVDDSTYYVRRPDTTSKEWSIGSADEGRIDWFENFDKFRDIKKDVYQRHSKPLKPVNLLEQLEPTQIKTIKEEGFNSIPKEFRNEVQDPKEWFAYQNYVREIEKLKKFLRVDTDAKLVDELKQQGPEFVQKQYRRMIESDVLRKYVEDAGLVGTKEWSAFRRGVNKIVDVKPLARQFDHKFGSNFEQTIDRISQRLNRVSSARASALSEMAELRKLTKRAKIENDDLYEFLNSGVKQGTTSTPEASKVLDRWRNFFNSLNEEANKMGLPITKRENYVPHQRSGAVAYTNTIDKKFAEATKYDRAVAGRSDSVDAFKTILSRKSTAESPNPIRDIADEMQSVLDERPSSPEEFRRLYEILTNPNSIEARNITMARAAIQRKKKEIPEWVREKNVYQLVKDWTSNTYRHAALRDELADLEQFKTFARNQGDSWAANYVDNLQRDIVGTRTDTFARWGNTKSKVMEIKLNRLATKLDEQGRTNSARLARGLTYVPEVYQMIMQSVYPNLLGLSGRAAFQNFVSAPIMNVPELGTSYGGKLATKSAARLLTRPRVDIEITPEVAQVMRAKLRLDSGEISPAKLEQLKKMEAEGMLRRTDVAWEPVVGAKLKTSDSDLILGSEGVLPAQWTGELISQLRNELKKSSLYQFGSGAYENWTKASMTFFEMSERMARMQTYHMANDVAADLMKGNRNAQKWLDNISSPSYARQIKKALDSDDSERVRQLTQRYFQSTNMFNYDRANMSAYGRYMGPIFSVFSKWPTSIAGRVIQELYDRKGKGAAKLGKQLVAPFALALIADSLLPTADESPERRSLLGVGGFTGMTPLSSLGGFVKGEFATPPVLQALGAVSTPLMSYDEKAGSKLNKSIQRGMTTFMPGANLFRILGEDIPQLMGVNVRKKARGRYKGMGKLSRQAQESLKTLEKISK